jgi:RHS repeat-associated protein
MRQIFYTYAKTQDGNNFIARIASERHGSPTGEKVSAIDPSNPPPSSAAPTFIETRGDGAKRTFTYGAQYSSNCAVTGRLKHYTDFENNLTVLHYSDPDGGDINRGGFLDEITDANGHVTHYDRGFIGAVYKITYPDNTFVSQTYTSDADPYYLKTRTDERGNWTEYIRNEPGVSGYDPNNPHSIKDKIWHNNNGNVLATEHFWYNSFGQVTKHQLKNGAYIHFAYDARGLLTDKWNPTWNATPQSSDAYTHYDYYASGGWTDRVQTETDPLGRHKTFEYDYQASNNEISGTTGASPCAGWGFVTKITFVDDTHNGALPQGTTQSFGYDVYGDKVWEKDELGKKTTHQYDDYGRLTVTRNPLNQPTTITYNPTYVRTTSSADALVQLLAPSLTPISAADILAAGANRTAYSHTSSSPDRVTTAMGVATTNTYDGNWRKLSTIVGAGTADAATTWFHYDAVGNLDYVTDPRGTASGDATYTTRTDYDTRDRKWHVTDAQGHVTTFAYWENGLVKTITRPDQTVETKHYDDLNYLDSDTIPKQRNSDNSIEYVTTTLVNNPSGTLRSVTVPQSDMVSLTTAFEYDAADMKTKMTYPDNPNDYQSWTYDSAHDVIGRRSANGNSQLFGYDARHRQIWMTWSDGADWASFDYDAGSRMKLAQNPSSMVTRGYDDAGRLTSERQKLQIEPVRAVSRKTHAGVGTFDVNLPLTGTPGVECRLGQGANFDQHQLVVTFPRPITFGGASVTAGTAALTTSLNGDHTQLTINLTGAPNAQTVLMKLAAVTDSFVTNDVNIGVGLLVGDVNSDTDVNSGDKSVTQSQLGQVVGTASFREDVNLDGDINSGDVSVVLSRIGTALGGSTTLTQPVATGPDVTINYVPDADGREQQMYVTNNANGAAVGYDYTFAYTGRSAVKSITPTSGSIAFAYTYDLASNETHRHNYLNGIDQDYGTPDNLNRMMKRDVKLSAGTVVSHEAYSYDPLRPGLLTAVDREDNTRDAFSYDLLPELTSAQYGLISQNGNFVNPQRACTYTFDKAGNRSAMTDTQGPSCNYGQPTKLNQYFTDGTNPITHGSEHEMASYKNVNYTYINDSHLQAVNGNGHSYTLNYDALGRTVVRVLDGSTTYFIFDGEKPILEYGTATQLKAKNVYGRGIDEILMRTDYTQTPALAYFYQDDHEGSITHLTNSLGQVIEKYKYDAFGAPTITHLLGPATNNRFMFTGREYMSTFGIYEYRNRAYHPGLGRFMSEDPKGFAGGDSNLFRFVHNVPLDLVDPMGLEPIDAYNPAMRTLIVRACLNSLKAFKDAPKEGPKAKTDRSQLIVQKRDSNGNWGQPTLQTAGGKPVINRSEIVFVPREEYRQYHTGESHRMKEIETGRAGDNERAAAGGHVHGDVTGIAQPQWSAEDRNVALGIGPNGQKVTPKPVGRIDESDPTKVHILVPQKEGGDPKEETVDAKGTPVANNTAPDTTTVEPGGGGGMARNLGLETANARYFSYALP